jgi:hypothetical protein
MISADYRIESSSPIASHWLPGSGSQQYLVHDRGLAVAVAAKSTTWPGGQEIRVVHVPTGEIVFRKQGARQSDPADEG